MQIRINCTGNELFKSDCYTANLKSELFITFKKYTGKISIVKIYRVAAAMCVCVCVPLKREKCTSKAIFLKENYFFNKNNALGKKSVEPFTVSLANISKWKTKLKYFSRTPRAKNYFRAKCPKYPPSPSYLP